MHKRLNDFEVLTFDCYGTLIDWETGIWDALQPLLMENACGSVSRERALNEYGRLESRQETETPELGYRDILARVHADIAAEFGLATTSQLDAEFADSLPNWPAFADTASALRFLKRHFKLVVLSNVHKAGFAASNRKLGVEFDAIYTAEDIGTYKPSIANFEYLLAHLDKDFGLTARDVLHTAQSMYHDHLPAKSLGLAGAWIDRQRLSESGDWGATAAVDEMPELDFVFFSMQELADAVASES